MKQTSGARTRGLAPLVVCLVAASTLASARVDAAIPTLGATNVVTGSRPAAMAVRLPSPARIDAGSFSDYSITGGGRFAGAILADGRGRAGTVLIVSHYNGCWTAGCVPQQPQPIGWLFVGGRPSTIMHAGTYTLYLIADGAPTRVTLRLHGPAGSATLKPPAYRGLKIATLTPQLAVGHSPLQPVWMASGTSVVGSKGGVLGTDFLFEGPTYVGSDSGVCLDRGHPPRVYVPECPTAYDNAPVLDLTSRPNYRAGVLSTSIVPGDSWTISPYYVGAALVREAHAASFWLSF